MKQKKLLAYTSTLSLLILLTACGGGSGDNNEALQEINESIDTEISHYSTSADSIMREESIMIDWRARGAVLFDAVFYLSDDASISSSDTIIISEPCGFDDDKVCSVNKDITFECFYQLDNNLECYEGNTMLGRTDITQYLDGLPKDGYLILELCNDSQCEFLSQQIRFY